jgi:hypothetical protein
MVRRIGYSKKRFGHDEYMITFLVIVIIAVFVVVSLFPQIIIGNLVGNTISAAIFLGTLTFFKLIYTTDNSGRLRRRGGPYGSKWVSKKGYNTALLSLAICMFIYIIVGHDFVVSYVTNIIIQQGQETGIPLFLFASLASVIMIFNLFWSLSINNK